MPTVSKATRRQQSARHGATLPQPPHLLGMLGPSFILLGLALGSGELILWPYLTAQYGLGLLWGALLGISFQYILNTEVMRYSLARGESVFLGFRRLSALIPVWYIISTFIPWSIPGFSSASGQIFATGLAAATGLSVETLVGPLSLALLVLAGVILSVGTTLYRTMEVFQRTIIMIGLPFIIVLVALLATPGDVGVSIAGLLGAGEGWWFFPSGVSLVAFMGAFAYSGAGGNLNLAQSYYVKEKGFGMGAYAAKISALFAGKAQPVSLEGRLFDDTPLNRKRWNQWWKLVSIEHGIVFFGLGLLSICLLAILAYATVYGHDVELHEGLSFLFTEAKFIGDMTHPLVEKIFLAMAAAMLFSTQLGVLESSSRITSENLLLLGYRKGKPVNLSGSFYAVVWGQILLGALVYFLGWREPRELLTIAAVLNGAAMMVSFPLIYWLNRSTLPVYARPGKIRAVVLLLATAFFASFLWMTLSSK